MVTFQVILSRKRLNRLIKWLEEAQEGIMLQSYSSDYDDQILRDLDALIGQLPRK